MPQIVLVKQTKFALRKVGLIAGAALMAVLLLVVAVNAVWAALEAVALAQAKSLDVKGAYGSEMLTLKQYLAQKPPRQFQYDVLIQLGDAATKNSDEHQAYGAYLRADTIISEPTLALKVKVAQAAAAAGDRATAAGYYQQAVRLVPKEPAATYEERVSPYQDLANELERTK